MTIGSAQDDSSLSTAPHVSKKRPMSFEGNQTSFKRYKHSEGDVKTSAPVPQLLSATSPSTISKPHAMFLDIKCEIQHILQYCATAAIVDQCANLMASSVNNIALFTTEHIQKLRECKSFPSLIQKLSAYYNWIDHSVLAKVIDACNSSAASNLLEQFKSQIDLSLPITDFPIPPPSPNMMPYDTSTHTVIAVRLNAKQRIVSLRQTLDMQCLLQEKFQLTSHSLLLLATTNMSSVLYWSIPKCVVSVITSNIAQISNDLHNSGIMELSIYPGFMFVTSSTLRIGSLSYLNKLNFMV